MDIARPFVTTLLLTFFTFVIIEMFFIKMDQNVQAYVDDAIEEFVDDSCNAGYISPSKYLLMAQRINNTGNIYTLTIQHDAKVAMPYVNASGEEVLGSYVSSVNTYNKEEILDEMFPMSETENHNYPLGNGDYLKVTLSLKAPSPAGRFIAFMTGREINTIRYSYGSYVGNSEENGMVK